MSAIVKANAFLTTGGLAVLKRSFTTEKEGRVTYSAEYVCLAQFANNHIGKFKTGSQPPTPVPASLTGLALRRVPTLYNLDTETINGLTYFRAVYTAAGSSESSFSITTSSEQRSFQGSVSTVVTTGAPGFETENPVTDYLSFDYISISQTASSVNDFLPRVEGRALERFNIRQTRTFAIGGSTVQGGSVKYRKDTVESSSSTRNSDGTYTYTKTSTGIYVQD